MVLILLVEFALSNQKCSLDGVLGPIS